MAAIMGIDIGINRKSKQSQQRILNMPKWREHQWKRSTLDTVETRRAWLGCFYLSSNAAMSLRRPNLISWTPFMEECIEVLENSPEALPSDRIMARWVRLQRIADQAGSEFAMEDPSSYFSMSDAKVQYAMKGFGRELDKWRQLEPNVHDLRKF
jgi:hypothetical protein